mgnify:CR=1 FL=1
MQFIGVSLLSFTVDLLGCLNWQKILRENDTASLKQHLHQLMRVDGEEIVKVDGRCCVQKTKYPTHSMYQCCVFCFFYEHRIVVPSLYALLSYNHFTHCPFSCANSQCAFL